MSGKNSLMHKKTSFTVLWSTIESIYGEIPELIKIVLQLSGFDSFLALKGIRYEDKNEFFSSLESTVIEMGSYHYETDEKRMLDTILGPRYNYKHFKLKPGHRNLIMNLMLEIDKVDVEEFFSKAHIKTQQKVFETIDEDIKTKLEDDSNKITIVPNDIKSSPKNNGMLHEIADHVYSHNDEQLELCNGEDEEYLFEEYLLEEEYMEDYTAEKDGYMFKTEDSETEVSYEFSTAPKKKQAQKRKPERMYNDEFLSQSINPRRRRVTTTKTYPENDEGTHERFLDLIQQSMQCILSQSKLDEVESCQIIVSKETDTSWTVICPLCNTKIKLAVVHENNGRYKNYKRSNFERHLRYKHCKEEKLWMR